MMASVNELPVLRPPFEVQHEELLDRSRGFISNRLAWFENARDIRANFSKQ
jgi:hypothetical protein